MATTYDSPREAVETRMAASFSTLPIAWDNHPAPRGAFVRVMPEPGFSQTALIGGGSNNLSVGKNPIQRHQGAAAFEINIEKDQGTKLANDVAEEIKALFVNQRHNEVDFNGSDIVRTGETDAHYQITLFVYYHHDNR